MNLQEMMNFGLRSRTVKHSGSKRTGVDTTVQGKALSYPTGSKFLSRSRERLNSLCQEHVVVFRHRYIRIGAKALCKANQYAYARQFRRMRGQVKKLHTNLGRVVRDIERKTESIPNTTGEVCKQTVVSASVIGAKAR